MATFAFKSEDPYPDLDFDDLLSKLSPEELEKLSDELIDPDVSYKIGFVWQRHSCGCNTCTI